MSVIHYRYDSVISLSAMILCVLTFPLLACQDSQKNSALLTNKLGQTFEGAKDAAVRGLSRTTDDISSMASEEVEKLFKLEYRVVELDRSLPREKMEESLSQLGAERWDCISNIAREDKILLLCKRYPKTYLRYIPRMF